LKIKELALLIEGTIEGDDNVDITDLSGIESARLGDLTFAIDEDKLKLAEISQTICVLTTRTSRKSTKTLIRVNNPKLAFLIAYNAFHEKASAESFVHPSAAIADSVILGKNVRIDAQVSIEDNVVIGDHTTIESGSVIKKNCKLGEHCYLHPNVVLYENTILKNKIILHAGVIVGSDGFGYLRDRGTIYKFPQLGTVVIEDAVEVGANSTIDRGSLGCTVIGEGSKIDNLCHIAHNVKIGKNVIMAAQCGIAGSTVIGDNVTMSGQVAIIDNVTIGQNVNIGGKSAVIGSIKDNTAIWGSPARELRQIKKQMAVLSWLSKNFRVLSKMVKEKDQGRSAGIDKGVL
jgi:UDP-3-O-[3-hydroxymyristoyl] glucosamine N-acyltransferase